MKFLSTFIFVLLFGATALAQSQATATFKASVTIIEPIGITNTADLDFAQVDADRGGMVVMTPEGNRLSKGGAKLAEGGNVSAATFNVTGKPGLSYTISLPDGQYFLTNGSNRVVLSNFTSNIGSTGKIIGKNSELRVGATVKFEPGQQPGIYSSTEPLRVTVNYN